MVPRAREKPEAFGVKGHQGWCGTSGWKMRSGPGNDRPSGAFPRALRPCRVLNCVWISEGPLWVQCGRWTREEKQGAGKSGRGLWKSPEERS